MDARRRLPVETPIARAQSVDVTIPEADLVGAQLEGAFLVGAHLAGANLIEKAFGDTKTRLPDGVARPADWPPCEW